MNCRSVLAQFVAGCLSIVLCTTVLAQSPEPGSHLEFLVAKDKAEDIRDGEPTLGGELWPGILKAYDDAVAAELDEDLVYGSYMVMLYVWMMMDPDPQVLDQLEAIELVGYTWQLAGETYKNNGLVDNQEANTFYQAALTKRDEEDQKEDTIPGYVPNYSQSTALMVRAGEEWEDAMVNFGNSVTSYNRAIHYWNQAMGILEFTSLGQPGEMPPLPEDPGEMPPPPETP